MSEQKSLVANVADPVQIKKAGERIKTAEMKRKNNMRTLLAMPGGEFKSYVALLLAETRVSQSIWSQSAAIHKDAGRQEIGHLILRHIVEVDEQACAALLTEAYKKEIEGEPL